ncbi:MAG: RsmE family RNA methyltransferase [Spirochaetota bacterium]
MRQLLLPGALDAGVRIALTGEDYHYLARVLRLRPGARLPALDESGARWTLELLDDDGRRLLARVEPGTSEAAAGDDAASGCATAAAAGRGSSHAAAGSPTLSFPGITVYQAIPKGRAFDESVRALVQAGVTRICPVVTERTVVRPSGGSSRTERWRRIAREAVQQSGAGRPTEVLEPVELSAVAARSEALSLVLHTEPLAQTSLHGYLGDTPNEIELVAGPEGGFSADELDGLIERGFSPLWLGPRVLRAESAALFAAAAMRILILEREWWQPATT